MAVDWKRTNRRVTQEGAGRAEEPMAIYLGRQAFSRSDLMGFRGCPQDVHFRLRGGGSKATAASNIGTESHRAILEPDTTAGPIPTSQHFATLPADCKEPEEIDYWVAENVGEGAVLYVRGNSTKKVREHVSAMDPDRLVPAIGTDELTILAKTKLLGLAGAEAESPSLDGTTWKAPTENGQDAVTQAVKAVVEELGGAILSASDMARTEEIRSAVWAKDKAKKMLEACDLFEMSMWWSMGGIPYRSRPDAGSTKFRTMVNFKTSADISDRGLRARMYSDGWALGAVMTLRGGNASIGEESLFDRHVWIVAQSVAPYHVRTIDTDAVSLRAGKAEWGAYHSRLLQCVEHDTWPGYPDEIETMPMDQWAVEHCHGLY